MSVFDGEIALMRTVDFVDRLASEGALTGGEARKVLACVLDKTEAVVGSLLLQVRLDKR